MIKKEKLRFIDNFIRKFVDIKCDVSFCKKYRFVNFNVVFHVRSSFYELTGEFLAFFEEKFVKYIKEKIKNYKFRLKNYCVYLDYDIKINFELKVHNACDIRFCYNVVRKVIEKFLKCELINILKNDTYKIDLDVERCFMYVPNRYVYDYPIDKEYKEFIQSISNNVDKVIFKKCFIDDCFPTKFHFIYSLNNRIFNKIKKISKVFYYDFKRSFLIDYDLYEKIKSILSMFLQFFNIKADDITVKLMYEVYPKFKIIIFVKTTGFVEGISFEGEKLKESVFSSIDYCVKEKLKKIFERCISKIKEKREIFDY